MKITCLMEDTCADPRLVPEHGLSLYIETGGKKLLFDTGAGSRFLENAAVLGVELSAVDAAVISHGHYDHGGGIPAFLSVNSKANVYIRRNAFDAYYHNTAEREKYIGLPGAVRPGRRLVPVDGDLTVEEGLYLFTGVTGRRKIPSVSLTLMRREGSLFLPDDFSHEQSLVITENGSRTLFCGCSHCGILNILDRFNRRFGALPDLVVGGFHLAKKGEYDEQELSLIRETAEELAAMPTRFFTCHCTGEKAYEVMKPLLRERLHYLRTGESITPDVS